MHNYKIINNVEEGIESVSHIIKIWNVSDEDIKRVIKIWRSENV